MNKLHKCINELCVYCGKYLNEHEGACNGCEWYPIKREERKVDTMLDIVEDLVINCEAEECYRVEIDEDGTEHKYPTCPFLDRDGYCKIGDPTSWVL